MKREKIARVLTALLGSSILLISLSACGGSADVMESPITETAATATETVSAEQATPTPDQEETVATATPTPNPEETVVTATPTPDPVSTGDGTAQDDRSAWEYDDYVNYYGFDPADYGYEWYNSIRSGPLEDFFEYVNGEINGRVYTSRLYEITDPRVAELTPDDFVGTWQTDGGIIFSIENRDGEYTMDLSENEGLGILGGWFSYSLYNIEDQFCGMSGENGVTSFSVAYGYGTDYPTNTWLELKLVDFEGNEIWDYVPLVWN